MGNWCNIRNDYFEDGVDLNHSLDGDILAAISIDAWKTPYVTEEGSVIARVMLSNNGDILVDYRDSLARIDEDAQRAISGAKERLKAYFQEKVADVGKDERAEKPPVYCLCETREEGDAIREFEILAISPDKDALKQLMKAKIAADEYGFSKENGVHYETEEYYSTNYEAEVGFVEYSISEMPVLSRNEVLHKAHGYDWSEAFHSGAERPSLDTQIRAATNESRNTNQDPVRGQPVKENEPR